MRLGERFLSITVVVFMIAALAGCDGGEPWHADTYSASGSITINGEPPEGAVVELRSIGEPSDARDSRPWAVVKADGSFELSTYKAGDGAPPGKYAVVVKWPPDVSQPSLEDRLGGVYYNPSKSEWDVTIEPGDNTLPPIEIEKAKLAPLKKASGKKTGPAGPPIGR